MELVDPLYGKPLSKHDIRETDRIKKKKTGTTQQNVICTQSSVKK